MKKVKNTKNKSESKWWIVDAKDKRLGRISTKIANLLRGKGKTSFCLNKDCGDYVIVKNVEKISLTGNKHVDKFYYSHSGKIGNLKKISAGDLLEKNPKRILFESVKGMLPKNKLRARFLKKLKLYVGDCDLHEAQKPEALEL